VAVWENQLVAAKVTTVCLDATDVEAVASFWGAVLGWDHFRDEDGDMVVADRSGASPFILLVLSVPEPKSVKNRLHLDLNPVGVDQAAELERLLSLGARRVDIGQGEQTWVVLADPEGNEFCLLSRRLDDPAGAHP
jgi:predicted enzyme related to lactoylglutathione lyase